MSVVLLTPTMQAARLKVVKDRPYLASVLYALQPVEVEGLGTMGVDARMRLFFDPACDKWGVDGCAAVMYHEVGHVLRAHHERMIDSNIGEDEALTWNLAGDCEINDDLVAEGIKFPEPPCLPKNFNMQDGLLAEEYMQQLRKMTTKVNCVVPGAGNGKCGLSGGNPTHGGESSGDDHGGTAPGIPKAEIDLIRRQVATEIKEACKSRGTVPGWLERWAEAILDPKTDWRKELAYQVRRGIADAAGLWDFTYRRPSRRNPGTGVIMPSFRAPRPNVAVVLDTSGSMGSKELAGALAEIKGVLMACGQKDGVKVYVTDHHVHASKKIWRPEQIQMTGGGGTDMRLGVKAALDDRPIPDVIIVLTDGYTPWPESPVGSTRLIAALVGKQPDTKVPDWIKRIIVEDD